MPTIISGQLQTWHKVTLDFTSNQTFWEEPGTFRDYRLDVTFTNAITGETVRVPGYFAADGEAADTNTKHGNVWRVNFNPSSEGEWTYEASFRTGRDIAASLNPAAGMAMEFDGAAGSFDITPSDKTGDDFRAKGMLLQDEGTHYLRHQGDGDYFVRGGPGVPENLLATADFDGWRQGFSDEDDATPGAESAGNVARHDFSNHLSDYDGDGRTWDGGKGQAILGAVNYLAEQGQNTIYVLTNTINGDGKDVGPWAGSGIYSGGTLSNDQVSTYDVSKLAQWEILFDHMDAKGIYINLLLQETENDQMLDGRTGVSGSTLSVERMVYMREMVARFGHGNGIQWNLGEENTNTDAQREDMAEWIKAIDGYDHLVVVHTFGGDHNKVYDPLLDVVAFDGPSFQTGAGNIRQKIIEFRDKSEASGDPWVLSWDEDSGNAAVIDAYSNNPDSANEKTLREAFWGTLTAGGSGGNWYIKGNGFGGHSFDQNLDDFKGFSSMWKWTAAATDFFNTYIPFHEMKDADALTTNTGDFVMADPGRYYVIYMPYGRAGEAKLNLNGHGGESFDVFWYNPREGGALISDGQIDGGGVRSIGAPPEDGGKDWVVLVRNTDLPDLPASVTPEAPTPPPAPVPVPPEAKDGYWLEENGIVKVQFEDIANRSNPPAGWIFQNAANGDNPGFEGDGYYYWKDEDSTALDSGANQGLMTASVFIQAAGTYTLFLRSARDSNTPSDARNDIWVKIDGDTTGVLPAGSPPMVEKDGFVKLYGASTSWGFSRNFDDKSTNNNPVSKLVLSEGFHTITFAGRSQGYHIDSFQLSRSGTPDNSLESSKFVTGEAPPPPPPPPPPPAPEPGPDGKVALWLVDAGTDRRVAPIEDDATLDAALLSSGSYSIEAVADPSLGVQSVRMTLGGRTQTESVAPFALFGDAGGDFAGAAVPQGPQTIRVELFSAKSGGGTKLGDVTLGFEIAAAPPPPPPPPPNLAPDATDDAAVTNEDEAVTIDVLANDGDPDGDALTLSVASGPDHGSVEIRDGRIVYTPDDGFFGADDFTYRITDDGGLSDTARVAVTVTEVPDAPPPSPFDLVFSASSDRSGARDLQDAVLSGDSFVFTRGTDGVRQVQFYLDDPEAEGAPVQTERVAAYDFAGTAGKIANAWDTSKLADGEHTITARITAGDGSVTLITESFLIDNVPDVPEPPAPPAGFTAPFDTSGPAFALGQAKLYGFGVDGGAASIGVSGGRIGVGGTGSASEIDFRPGSNGGETIGVDFGAAVEAMSVKLAALGSVGGAREAGVVRTYDAAGDLMETFVLKGGTVFDLGFEAPVRYATLQASDWVDGADPGWDPDISLVAIEAYHIL